MPCSLPSYDRSGGERAKGGFQGLWRSGAGCAASSRRHCPCGRDSGFVALRHAGLPLPSEGRGSPNVPQPLCLSFVHKVVASPKRDSQGSNSSTKSMVRKRGGWGTWIRTRTNGVRVRGSTVNLFPNEGRSRPSRACGMPGPFNDGPKIVKHGQTSTPAAAPDVGNHCPACQQTPAARRRLGAWALAALMLSWRQRNDDERTLRPPSST